MDFFPLFANLRDQPCLLVGGGEVAARKARELAAAGARITVNAPDFTAVLRAMASSGAARLHPGPFDPALIADHLLVIAATGDPAVNRRVADGARAALRLCNVVDDGPGSSFIVPATVDRSPLIVAISSGGRSPVLSRLLRQRLDQWLPSRLGLLAEWAGSWRDRVKKTLPDIASRRAFWERLLTGPAATQVLGGNAAAAEKTAAALLAGATATPVTGCAWLVGAGPGDPGLISVRGLAVLQQADVILHDRLVAPALLRAARREAEIVCVGKTGGGPSTRQEDINRLLVNGVRAGRKVCRLKGGDPFIFGRGAEEAQALAVAGLPFEIVPGITAASGCAAYAGIPLTHRGLATAVTLVSASSVAATAGPDWGWLARAGHTLVVYMGGSQLAGIAGELLRHGRLPSTPAAFITNGTTPEQQLVLGTLADIAARGAACRSISPALLIVGETAALAVELAWPDRSGITVSDAVTVTEPLFSPPAALVG